MSESDVIDCLQALIDTCRHAEVGFRSCAGNADRMDLQLMMTQRDATWHRWAGELQVLCADSPGTPGDDSAASACVSWRGWGAAKATLSGYSDLALLAECERGEEIALQHYRHVLEQDVPRVVRAVAQRHAEGIQRSRAHLRTLRAGAELAHA